MRQDTRGIVAWCLYDWANSSFPAVISTFVFATYFTKAVAPNVTLGTAMWSWSVTTSALAIAVFSPVFGSIADAAGRRKPWLLAFTVVMVLTTFALWQVKPDPAYAILGLVLYGVANAGFELGTVFYNAMLADIVPAGRLGRVSGWGWGAGYAGGLVCLVLILFLFVQAEHPLFGLGAHEADNVRVSGPLCAIWTAVFAIPLFLWTPDAPRKSRGLTAVKSGLRELAESFRNVRAHKNVLLYLIAHMIYTDGLNTLFAFGGIYAAGTFGMSFAEVAMFGIGMNITAGLGAAAFAWVDDWIGSKRTISIALLGLMVFGAAILLIEGKTAFWVLALFLGLFFGPAQAASRSLMARMAPPELRAQMFGLYAMSGKATAFVGPFALGMVTLAFDSQRAGMGTVLIFFAVGLALLWRVKEPARG